MCLLRPWGCRRPNNRANVLQPLRHVVMASTASTACYASSEACCYGLYSMLWSLYTLYSILCGLCGMLWSLYTLYSILCGLCSMLCGLCSLYSIFYGLYSLYSLYSTFWSAKCITGLFLQTFLHIFWRGSWKGETQAKNLGNEIFATFEWLACCNCFVLGWWGAVPCEGKSCKWTTTSFDFHQMAVHKRTTMLAHCNLKQNMWLCSKQSSFFPFMHCHLVANQKMRWSIEWIFYNPRIGVSVWRLTFCKRAIFYFILLCHSHSTCFRLFIFSWK